MPAVAAVRYPASFVKYDTFLGIVKITFPVEVEYPSVEPVEVAEKVNVGPITPFIVVVAEELPHELRVYVNGLLFDTVRHFPISPTTDDPIPVPPPVGNRTVAAPALVAKASPINIAKPIINFFIIDYGLYFTNTTSPTTGAIAKVIVVLLFDKV